MKREDTIDSVERSLIEMEYALQDALRTGGVSRGEAGEVQAHIPLFVLRSTLTSLHQALAALRAAEVRPRAYMH